MTTTDLTQTFFQLRNKYSHSLTNPAYYDDSYNDKSGLLDTEADVDLARHSLENSKPNWTTGTDYIKSTMEISNVLLKDLKSVHDKLLAKPLSFDDGAPSENEQLLKEKSQKSEKIANNLHLMEKKLKSFNKWRKTNKLKISQREYIIMENISSLMATNLANLTSEYSKLKNLFEKQTRRKCIGENELAVMEEINLDGGGEPTLNQIRQREQMNRQIETRENAITNVTKEIYELNRLFKDVAAMVVEQGTVLDRIDHNIDLTAERVEKGHDEVQKARSHQKKNYKLKVIMCEAITLLLLFLLFVWRHS